MYYHQRENMHGKSVYGESVNTWEEREVMERAYLCVLYR